MLEQPDTWKARDRGLGQILDCVSSKPGSETAELPQDSQSLRCGFLP